MGEKLRVVLDTNVWVSIILDKTLAEEFTPLIDRREIEVCISRPLVKELGRVLAYPRISEILEKAGVQRISALSQIIRSATMVRTWRTIHEIKDDEEDNRVLECAVYAKADFVVSGDKHVLKLGEFKDIRILSPRKFLEMAKRSS